MEIERKVDRIFGDCDRHPSFGVVQFSRVQHGGGGRRRMFGSRLPSHPITIQLSIHRAERSHSLSRDRFFDREPLVVVDLTTAQFSELITTMNQGAGVPCTILFDGEAVDSPPDDETEQERVANGFVKKMQEMGRVATALQQEANKLLEKPTLIKADRERLREIVKKMASWTQDAAPFAMSQFIESATKVATEAKAQVDAFITSALVRAGLNHFQSLLLPEHKDDDANTNT